MEKKTETIFGRERERGFRAIAPVMENQTEKNMENAMETGTIWVPSPPSRILAFHDKGSYRLDNYAKCKDASCSVKGPHGPYQGLAGPSTIKDPARCSEGQ